MEARINEEIALLKKYYPDLQVHSSREWIFIPAYPMPESLGWSKDKMDVCIAIPKGYPATKPYGIYVPANLRFNGEMPANGQPKAKHQPPFPGSWMMLSWSPESKWNPGSNIVQGSNLLNFVRSFSDRFNSGK